MLSVTSTTRFVIHVSLLVGNGRCDASVHQPIHVQRNESRTCVYLFSLLTFIITQAQKQNLYSVHKVRRIFSSPIHISRNPANALYLFKG